MSSMLPAGDGAAAAREAVLDARVGELVMRLVTTAGLPAAGPPGAEGRLGPDLLSPDSSLRSMLISGLSAEEIQEVAAVLADLFPAAPGAGGVVLAALVPNSVDSRVEDFLLEVRDDYWENVAARGAA